MSDIEIIYPDRSIILDRMVVREGLLSSRYRAEHPGAACKGLKEVVLSRQQGGQCGSSREREGL